jgi:outer membrane protein assembly factor BamB
MMRIVTRAVACTLLCLATASADDWPQYRGPGRNGISAEAGWLTKWPEGSPPRIAWRIDIGKGHSAVSITGEHAVTMGWDGERDTVCCLDAFTGKTRWEVSYPCATILQWPGPRATPTIHAGRIFTLGQHGQLRAWELTTGKLVWQRNLPEKYNPDVDYGFCWSPLIVPTGGADDGNGDLLLLNAGSRGLAIRTRDGSIAWGDDGQKGACVSAVPYRHKGIDAVLIVNINEQRSAANLVGIESRTGRELWRHDGWQEQWGAMGVDSIVHDGKLFITSAQEYRQAARFTIDGKSLQQDWSTNRVAGYTGSAVLLRDHLYLVDSRGILRCLDWNTGKEAWSQRGFDERGTLIAADGMLLIQTGASGKLIVAAADSQQYRELRSIKVFEGKPETYKAPTIANGRIFCRSYAGEVVCLDVSGR